MSSSTTDDLPAARTKPFDVKNNITMLMDTILQTLRSVKVAGISRRMVLDGNVLYRYWQTVSANMERSVGLSDEEECLYLLSGSCQIIAKALSAFFAAGRFTYKNHSISKSFVMTFKFRPSVPEPRSIFPTSMQRFSLNPNQFERDEIDVYWVNEFHVVILMEVEYEGRNYQTVFDPSGAQFGNAQIFTPFNKYMDKWCADRSTVVLRPAAVYELPPELANDTVWGKVRESVGRLIESQ